MITLTNLRKVYGQGPSALAALDGVSLHVPAGAIFGVLGQSGAGKSTLIRCVNMLERPTAGSVLVDGQEMTTLSDAELRAARQRIGMIFQHFNLLSSRTVADNVAFPLEVIGGVGRAERRARVAELLGLVGLSDKAGAYPAQLSGGQKQRVGIARALAGAPSVLLSDEATSALDPQTTATILDLLRHLNRQLGLTVLLITHEMSVVRQICDHVAILHAGRVVEQGSVRELLARPDSRLTAALFPPPPETPAPAGALAATVTLVGELADRPLISELARRLDVDITILSGAVETVGNQRVGRLRLALAGARRAEALEELRALGAHVELHHGLDHLAAESLERHA
ncbi:MAG TPA: ATP-binding cassette domain-containing protein [Roseiflexaceae bacterium]|nr:ATP-binding cassette domain-containing protein [Roseiflexaceae bacterium]